jgi:[ribosomal protein S18]-alanine N-acetyltransferase
MRCAVPEVRQVGPSTEAALAHFFALLQSRGVDRYFHPHPFTPATARERALYSGQDFYCILADGDRVLGYGMLRGWDEGYEMPSLGIVIHPDMQSRGLGRALMGYLQFAARYRGAKRMRLRVHPDNAKAVQLYRSLGYQLAPETGSPYLIGSLDLGC